ncbi:hypothetical protein SK128_006728 [Halocaridina rubra]|uniref:RGS domain-containing protein n=1 Tax=Halocaridina rubra TaxID=373956 RepID=A0AAN8XGI3_HALRR
MYSILVTFANSIGQSGGSDSPNHGGSHIHEGAVAQSPSQSSSSPNRGPLQPVQLPYLGSSSSHYFILEDDEQRYLNHLGEGQDDPLLVESQFVKTVSDIFSSQSALPYFLQFLQGWGADKYARFWLDIISFRASAETRIRNHDAWSSDDLRQIKEDLSIQSDKGRGKVEIGNSYTEKFLGNCTESDISNQMPLNSENEDLKSQIKDLILPDLVSNIQNASDVTPLHSPNAPSSVPDCGSSYSKDVKDRSSQTVDETIPNESALESLKKDDGGIMNTNTWTRTRAQKLRQSIADDALRIYQKYIAKDAEYPIYVDDTTREEICLKIQITKQDISPDCFESAQTFVFSLLKKE